MQETRFLDIVKEWFGKIAKALENKVNGKKGEEPKYLFKEWLKPTFSVDLKWSTIRGKYKRVMADVVSMDSALPLKKRASVETADGNVPKLGMEKYLGEKDLSDLDIMENKGGLESEVVKKLFADTKACVIGVYERLEFMTLQALSTGVTSITDENNNGIGVRLDYEIPKGNIFGASKKWSEADAKPLDDIEKVLDKATEQGDSPKFILMGKTLARKFRQNEQVKSGYATYIDAINTNQRPTLQKVNEFLEAEYGITIIVIDRTCIIENANGKQVAVNPWKEDAVTFLNSLNVGDLVYGSLAEERHSVTGVEYQKIDNYILVSKYSVNRPALREYSSSQANVCPVLNDVDSIYILNTDDAIEVDKTEVENDDTITIYDAKKTKSEVIGVLKAMGVSIRVDVSDKKLIEIVNDLSDEDEATFKVEFDKLTTV
ncbi:MAG: major capsid protein [Tenacibaculum sp.]|nr:major capsid protein [Tenacibaculum sp.]